MTTNSGFTRLSIATKLQRAFDKHGIEHTAGTFDGRLGYMVEGTLLTPGEVEADWLRPSTAAVVFEGCQLDYAIEATEQSKALAIYKGGVLHQGPFAMCDDGYDVSEQLETRGWRCSANHGNWPFVMELFKVHDPKDNADAKGGPFLWLRFQYAERDATLGVYMSQADAMSEAAPLAEGV